MGASTKAAYPEHEKLHEVVEESQTIGEFLDFGLPKLGLCLYEKVVRDCNCVACRRRAGRTEGMHTKDEQKLADGNRGKVPITEWRVAMKTIKVILAEYFGIDQDKIDAEKEQMLAVIREANS